MIAADGAPDGRHRWRMLFTDADEFRPLDGPIDRAAQAGIHVATMAGHEPAEIVARGADCDGLILFRARIDDALLSALPRCKLLARAGAGYDLIDVAAAMRRGVMVTYVPDFCTEEMSDQVLLFVLVFARRLTTLMQAAREHRWLPLNELPPPSRLVGKTLGALGFGRSGQRTAEKARAFGLDILVWTRTPRQADLSRTGARSVSFADVLGCDFVTLHVPLTAGTRGLIGREALHMMKPTSYLINVARGALVDTGALVEALRDGTLAGAGLDVIDPSPLPAAHPLWDLPNVVITSHSAGFSQDAYRQSLRTVIEDTIAFANGLPPRFPVPELGDRARRPPDSGDQRPDAVRE
jgi:D-3-phosphoglycerate dehydrogenase